MNICRNSVSAQIAWQSCMPEENTDKMTRAKYLSSTTPHSSHPWGIGLIFWVKSSTETNTKCGDCLRIRICHMNMKLDGLFWRTTIPWGDCPTLAGCTREHGKQKSGTHWFFPSKCCALRPLWRVFSECKLALLFHIHTRNHFSSFVVGPSIFSVGPCNVWNHHQISKTTWNASLWLRIWRLFSFDGFVLQNDTDNFSWLGLLWWVCVAKLVLTMFLVLLCLLCWLCWTPPDTLSCCSRNLSPPASQLQRWSQRSETAMSVCTDRGGQETKLLLLPLSRRWFVAVFSLHESVPPCPYSEDNKS